MNTLLLKNSDSHCVKIASSFLNQGDLVALPTETVYGLAADATNREAVRKIFDVKKRPLGHPLIMHFSDISELKPWVKEIPDQVFLLAKHCWPGPLSLLLNKSNLVMNDITGGSSKVCVRIPNHPTTREIIHHLGRPIVAPSANLFGGVSPTCAEHVLHDLNGRIAMIVDGGECGIGLESTILDMTTPQPLLLRPGGYSLPDLEMILGSKILLQPEHQTKVSGNLLNHYQPNTKLLSVSRERMMELCQNSNFSARSTFMVLGDIKDYRFNKYKMPTDAKSYGQILYAVLRMLDKAGLDEIFIETPPNNADWMAVNDRISKATHK